MKKTTGLIVERRQQEASMFDVDRDRLDEELSNQARFYRERADRLAEASRDHAVAKAHKAVVVAEVDKDVRLHPENYGLEGKVTEGMVERTITLQNVYQTALRAEIDAKHLVDVCEADVWAATHRKMALEKLVDLRLSDYWAEPRAGGGAKRDAAFGRRREAT